MEEAKKVEQARHAEETALALVEVEKAKSKAAIEAAQAAQRIAELEAQKRLHAELKAKQEAEEKMRALNALAQNDHRYRRYNIDEIEVATEYFSESLKIGEGGSFYKDFHTDQKFTVTTYTSTGVAITATGTKKNDFLLGEIQSQLKNKNVTVDVKANSESNVLTTFTIDDLGTPGLKTIIGFVLPDQRSGKVELQYLHDYAGVTTSLGLTANPIINFSGVFGTNSLAVGADVSLDTASGNFTKYNAALSITNADLVASLNLYKQGDLLIASYYHLVNPLTNTAVGAELTHSFSSNDNTLTFERSICSTP
ncbi:hypothetical protein HPP92_006171 [Vanilla planifolia]|uniref:Uncharacterized protein n=1 Tax=Vanilla planifolia TaxID=51239 RepID=A0A835S054_VANPL|nr:hypothetical protein HPP92_006171 [Vanilla planifolia]